MADITQPTRVEPPLGPTPTASPVAELRAVVEGASAPPPPALPADRPGLDQLSRIEDKTARIEEKYARSEALLNRVEERVERAASRMGEAASSQDMASLRGEVSALDRRVRGLPGFAGLLLIGVLSGLIGAGATVAALRFGVPGVMPPVIPAAGAPR
ncbi:MAG TPA: hypothetical protein VEA41_20535 [Salinarimonas sp.]|jgi:hypothetical protein|nr:hypothetical protein [Salinarimonas sp.]